MLCLTASQSGKTSSFSVHDHLINPRQFSLDSCITLCLVDRSSINWQCYSSCHLHIGIYIFFSFNSLYKCIVFNIQVQPSILPWRVCLNLYPHLAVKLSAIFEFQETLILTAKSQKKVQTQLHLTVFLVVVISTSLKFHSFLLPSFTWLHSLLTDRH